jgi:hypothetical protein
VRWWFSLWIGYCWPCRGTLGRGSVGLVFGLDSAGCVEVQVKCWVSLWIGYCWLCRGT